VLPFLCDDGANIVVGANGFVNTGCVVLDCAPVAICDNVLIGPGVHLYTATHPVDPALRRRGLELAAPITTSPAPGPEDGSWRALASPSARVRPSAQAAS